MKGWKCTICIEDSETDSLKVQVNYPKRHYLHQQEGHVKGSCSQAWTTSEVCTWSPTVSLYLRMTWGGGTLFSYPSQQTPHLCPRGGLLSSLGRWQMEYYLVHTLNNCDQGFQCRDLGSRTIDSLINPYSASLILGLLVSVIR